MARQRTAIEKEKEKLRERTSGRRIQDIERASEALELRKKGKPYDVVARELGFNSATAARRAVEFILERSYDPEAAREVLLLDLATLDKMQELIWPKVEEQDLWAVDRVLAIMARRAKLVGLDKAPVPPKRGAVAPKTVRVTLEMGREIKAGKLDDEDPVELVDSGNGVFAAKGDDEEQESLVLPTPETGQPSRLSFDVGKVDAGKIAAIIPKKREA